jgi:hypothetical protein
VKTPVAPITSLPSVPTHDVASRTSQESVEDSPGLNRLGIRAEVDRRRLRRSSKRLEDGPRGGISIAKRLPSGALLPPERDYFFSLDDIHQAAGPKQ